MTRIVPLSEADPAAVEALIDAAFGTDRHGRTAYRLREGALTLPGLSFAAFDANGALAGTLQSWPVELFRSEGDADPMVLVGPVAVRPDLQRAGIGRALMAKALAAADASDTPPMMLIGDPEYYDRFFGFSSAATADWQLPGPFERHRLLARVRAGQTLGRHGLVRPRRCHAASVAARG